MKERGMGMDIKENVESVEKAIWLDRLLSTVQMNLWKCAKFSGGFRFLSNINRTATPRGKNRYTYCTYVQYMARHSGLPRGPPCFPLADQLFRSFSSFLANENIWRHLQHLCDTATVFLFNTAPFQGTTHCKVSNRTFCSRLLKGQHIFTAQALKCD